MADTDINAASLTVTITEALSVGHDVGADARDFAQTMTHTFASIANVSKRVLKLENTNLTEVATFGSGESVGIYKRAFHYRLDHEETNKTGMPVIYKVPILDDYYHKIVWKRPLKYAKCKILPLTFFKNLINNKK